MDIKIIPESIDSWQVFKGVSTRLVVNGQNMTALKSTWAPGAGSTLHRHHNEQILYCLEGEMYFSVNGNEYAIKAGEIVYIPSNAPHCQTNRSDRPAVFLECFSPIREDMLAKKFDPK